MTTDADDGVRIRAARARRPAPVIHGLAALVETVRASSAPAPMTTRVVAIDGPGGAGKSTLAEHLARELGFAAVVHTDDFASPEHPLDWWPRLLREVLEPLARNEVARYRPWDWDRRRLGSWVEVAPAPFVVVEGVSASRVAFRPYLAYSIWVETPRELRLRRGLDRDGEAARPQWERWMAEEDEYVRQNRPQQHVDVVVRGDADLWR